MVWWSEDLAVFLGFDSKRPLGTPGPFTAPLAWSSLIQSDVGAWVSPSIG